MAGIYPNLANIQVIDSFFSYTPTRSLNFHPDTYSSLILMLHVSGQ